VAAATVHCAVWVALGLGVGNSPSKSDPERLLSATHSSRFLQWCGVVEC